MNPLKKLVTPSVTQKSQPQILFWLGLSITFAIFYGVLALQQAFSAEYIVQDDARQHVFWLRRFLDSELFPHDLIADYFQSVAPLGYTGLYRVMAVVGIDPILLSKILPLFLGIVATGYCFALSFQLLPIPLTGFIASLLLNQNLWMQDGLISGTPKAFIYPIYLAFLYYLVKRSLFGVGLSIAFLGLFYPSLVLVCVVILILQLWRIKGSWGLGAGECFPGLPSNSEPPKSPLKMGTFTGLFSILKRGTLSKLSPLFKGGWGGSPELQNYHRFRYFSQNRQDYIFCLTNLTVAFLILLPYILKSSQFSPVLTAAIGKTLPELSAQGKTRFFVNDSWAYWFHGRSGIGLASALAPPLIYTGLLLPILLKFSNIFPLAKEVRNIGLIVQLLLASSVMFFAAHGVLFKLHLPSRYTQHSLKIAIAIAAGILLTLILDAIWGSGESHKSQVTSQDERFGYSHPDETTKAIPQMLHPYLKTQKLTPFPFPLTQLLKLGTTAIIGTTLILYPHLVLKHFPWTDYITGNVPSLYEFLQQQPKDSLIASLTAEANNLPSFAQRSILVGQEYAVPYHMGYYRQFRQRIQDLIQAQYSLDPQVVRDFIQKYGIDFWLVSANSFTPEYIMSDRWLIQYQPAANLAITQLQSGKTPVLALAMSTCSVLDTQGLIVLPVNCILDQVIRHD